MHFQVEVFKYLSKYFIIWSSSLSHSLYWQVVSVVRLQFSMRICDDDIQHCSLLLAQVKDLTGPFDFMKSM